MQDPVILEVHRELRVVPAGDRRVADRGVALGRLAEAALVTLALTLACDVFMVTHLQFGNTAAAWSSLATLVGCAVLWYGVALSRRLRRTRRAG